MQYIREWHALLSKQHITMYNPLSEILINSEHISYIFYVHVLNTYLGSNVLAMVSK